MLLKYQKLLLCYPPTFVRVSKRKWGYPLHCYSENWFVTLCDLKLRRQSLLASYFHLFPFLTFVLFPVFTWSSPTVSRSPRTVSSGIRFFGRLLSFGVVGRLLPVGLVGRLRPVGLVGRLISAGLDFIGLTGRLAFEVLLAGTVVLSSSLVSPLYF